MKSYSLDLRERVAAACAQPGRTIGTVATQFSVSVSFVEKLLHLHRTNGSLMALPLRSGPWPLLDAAARVELVACLRQQPDATLDELRVWGGRAGRTGCEPSYAGAGGADTGLAAKKKSVHAAERDTELRALRATFLEARQTENVTCFKFVDETSTNLTYGRRYARAEGGQRAHQATPLHGGPNVTLMVALTPSGLQAVMTGSRAVNGDVFAAYLD